MNEYYTTFQYQHHNILFYVKRSLSGFLFVCVQCSSAVLSEDNNKIVFSSLTKNDEEISKETGDFGK